MAVEIVAVTVVIGASFYGGWALRGMQPVAQNVSRDANRNTYVAISDLRTIEEIQRLVGCEKIDGIWGPETDRKYKRALCDQYAKEAGRMSGPHNDNGKANLGEIP